MTLAIDDAAALSAESKHGPRDDAAAWPRVTLEMALYAALIVLALALRLADLGSAPLDNAEAREALSALRAVNDNVPGDVLVSHSPLTFVLHAIGFTFFPASDLAARLPVALGGVLLALSPALWRRYLGPLPPLIISCLLVVSPVGGLASRTGSPVIWTMLLAVTGPWLVLRFIETQARGYAVAAMAGCVVMALLVEPAGLLTLIALAFGLGFAWLLEEGVESEVTDALQAAWRGWPWADGALAAGAVILVIGTGLFSLPYGLTGIGETLAAGVEGFVTRPGGVPVAYPLWVALRYEPGIALFGLIACYRALREGGFFERALVGWALMGLVWSLAYIGAGAAYALWLVLPLTVLVGLMVARWLTAQDDVVWHVPGWGVPLHAVVTVALWLAVGISLLLLAKLLYELPDGLTDREALIRKLLEDVYTRNTASTSMVEVQSDVFVVDHVLGNIQLRTLITMLVTLLNGVLYFLVGSMWGARASWRGLALGTLVFGLLFGFGAGWRGAYLNWDDPRELWYTAGPVSNDAHELHDTLREMSLRATGEPHLIDIVAWVPENGALAWVLRDFPNTTFVSGTGAEINAAAVIVPVGGTRQRMGADYVGKELSISPAWDISALSWRDELLWFYRAASKANPTPGEQVMLWIRKDVYGVEQVTEN